MSDAAKNVRYKPLHSALDFGNYGLAGKLTRAARKEGIKDAKPRIAAHVAKNMFYRAANPIFERFNLTGLAQYKTRRMSRSRFFLEKSLLGGFSNINSASMIEANAVRGEGKNEEVVGGGCKIAGRRESVGVVQRGLGNPMGRKAYAQQQEENSYSRDYSEAAAAYTNAPVHNTPSVAPQVAPMAA